MSKKKKAFYSEEVIDTVVENDYIKEEEIQPVQESKPTVQESKPKQVTFKDRPLAQKLKLPNRQIY